MTGILPTSGINAVTYTDATPTLPELLVPVAQALSKCATVGKRTPDSIVLYPSIWWWMTAQLDSTNRPLVDLGNGQNTITVHDTDAVSGVVGAIGKVPIVVDLGIPTNLGGGTNESRVIAGALRDTYLWEGALRTRVLTEVLSGTLQVRLQVYNYVAYMANRRPAALSVVSGTGLIPPTGY
ncbi:hypothetical protein [Nocardioides sp.]|uniref:hypothetical protein n=1 Tax=Nocardioides sp. TaxID=35761 RepID=UPI0037841C0E